MKYLLSILGSMILSFLAVTGWFLAFETNPNLWNRFLNLFQNISYLLGMLIFSAVFFLFFALPLALVKKGRVNGQSTPSDSS